MDLSMCSAADVRLRETECALRALIDAQSECVLLLGRDGKVLACNRSFASQINQSVASVIGTCVFDHLPSGIVQERKRRLQEVVATARPMVFEEIRRGRHIESHLSPVFDKAGRVESVAVVAVDLTERRRAEQERERERERLLLDLLSAVPCARRLTGVLPICSECKRIRNDAGSWISIEAYIRDHSEADFSHGLCPHCAEELYPEYCDELTPGEGQKSRLQRGGDDRTSLPADLPAGRSPGPA